MLYLVQIAAAYIHLNMTLMKFTVGNIHKNTEMKKKKNEILEKKKKKSRKSSKAYLFGDNIATRVQWLYFDGVGTEHPEGHLDNGDVLRGARHHGQGDGAPVLQVVQQVGALQCVLRIGRGNQQHATVSNI